MKLLVFVLAAAAIVSLPRKKVIFFGDSITEAGVKPGGYVVRTADLAAAEKLSDQFEISGSGIGGNKIYDLYLRLDEDVLAKAPDIVVIYVGVNDVWHKSLLGTGTDPDKFERFYNALLKKLREKNIKAVLCTPAAVGERTDFTNELDGDLNRYCEIVRRIAAQNNLPLVDLRKAFLEYNRGHNTSNQESGILTSDRVHLNDKGNALVAEEMWKVIKKM